MKKILWLLLSIACISIARDAHFAIFTDCMACNLFGHDNFDMNTNGEQLLLSQLIKNNDVVFDVGANVGNWSMKLFSFAPEAFVYAFEPIPETYESLHKNLRKYPARVFNIALSNTTCEKVIAYYNKSSKWAELSSLYRRKNVELKSDLKPVLLTIQAFDLDTFCMEKNIRHIDFLKIDTEGSELDILQGSKQQLLYKKIKYIQFEYGGTYLDAKSTLKQMYDLLTAYGYTLYRIMPRGLIRIDFWHDALESYRYANYLAASQPL